MYIDFLLKNKSPFLFLHLLNQILTKAGCKNLRIENERKNNKY